jgi:hypothetical protein
MLNPARDILIGTSGFSYPGAPPGGWYGVFYPEKKTKGFDELKYYSQIFAPARSTRLFTDRRRRRLPKRGPVKRPMILVLR